MRLMHLTAGNLYGGIETYLATLARCQHLVPEIEHEFALCFPGRLRDELKAAGAPVHDLGPVRVSRPWTILRARRGLLSLLRSGTFAAAISHGSWPHLVFAPAVRSAGVKLAYAVHDALTRPSTFDRWAARTPPDLVIANSKFTAGPATLLFPRSRIEVIYIPVPPPQIDDREIVKREVRESLATNPESVVILQASRLERWKGQTVHIEALKQLRDLPGWEAWFAGGVQRPHEDEYLSELKEAAVKGGISDRVKFLGQRSDIPRLMAAADIFCQPNTGPEPFGIVFVEALYAGLPIVSSNFGGAAEIPTDACGELISPGDSKSLEISLRRLILEPEKRLLVKDSGPKRARELCDPATQIGKIASILGSDKYTVLAKSLATTSFSSWK